MRGRDEETGEFLAPSRSDQRRDALAVRSLAEALGQQSRARLEQMALPEGLMDEIIRLQQTTSHIAHKRQMQYVAKLMRREDDETLDQLRAMLANDKAEGRKETAALHRAEAWRERLLDEGDPALAELLDSHPDADRQQLRQLVRKATAERKTERPPHAQRELFRWLRGLLGEDGAA